MLPGFARIDYTGVPEAVTRCGDGTAKLELTKGDGNCAIHSVFGKYTWNGFFHQNASDFLYKTFGPTVATFTARLKDSVLLEELKQVLWLELVRARAVAVAENSAAFGGPQTESDMIWQEIMKDHALETACVNAALEQEVTHASFLQKRLEVVSSFAAVCIEPFRDTFVRPLLLSLGLLEEYANTASMLGCSKLDALFVKVPEAEYYHQSIVEHCGVHHFQTLYDRAVDILNGMTEWSVEFDLLSTFTAHVHQANLCIVLPNAEPFPLFFERMYKAYLDAMRRRDYYLSDVELIALCRCAQVNVIISDTIRKHGRWHIVDILLRMLQDLWFTLPYKWVQEMLLYAATSSAVPSCKPDPRRHLCCHVVLLTQSRCQPMHLVPTLCFLQRPLSRSLRRLGRVSKTHRGQQQHLRRFLVLPI